MSKWGKFLKGERFVAAIVGTIVPGVAKAQQAGEAIARSHSGKEKQDAVIDLVKHALEASESMSGKDLLNDPEAEAATRAVIDAVVNLHHVVAKQPPAPVVGSTGD